MSKSNENDHQTNNQSDPGGNKPSNNKQELFTVEEHKKNFNVDAPVFAAVMQTKGWGSGKKVPEDVFKKAVEDFLGAPMGGK